LAALPAIGPAPAQQAPGSVAESLLFTAGTTTVDGNSRPWAYLLWQSPDGKTVLDRQFAVYGKAGAASSTNLYEPLGVVSGALSPAVISVQLSRAEQLGQDLAHLDTVIEGFGEALGLTLTGDRAARVALVLQAARGQAGIANSIHTIASSSPALALCLGNAWAGLMPAGITTYEVRERDPNTGADLSVVGRVTLEAGVAVPLPRPGTPVQVPDSSFAGDRSVSLRWATPDDLRRRALLFRGFQLWRMPWSAAVAQNFHTTPPSTATLLSLAQGGQVKSLNPLTALQPTKLFTTGEVSNFGADPSTFYFVDNNGRFATPPGAPMADGAEYAYLVTGRDILGRDGLVSAAGRGQACRTLSPAVPGELAVSVLYDAPAMPGKQMIRVQWATNAIDPDLPPPTHYEVYRGTDQADLNMPGPNPANLLAVVPHNPANAVTSYDDLSFNQGGNQEASFYGQNYWYAVRAVTVTTTCGTLTSTTSPPMFGALRDQRPLDAPEGGFAAGACPQPVVRAMSEAGFPVIAIDPPTDGGRHYRLTCERRDAGIEWVDFSVTADFETTEIGRYYFGEDSMILEVDFTLPDYALESSGNNKEVWKCRVGNGQDQVSNMASVQYRAATNGQRNAILFEAGTVSVATANPSDLLAGTVLAAPVNLSVTAPDRNGMVVATGLVPGREYTIRNQGGPAAGRLDWGVVESTGRLIFIDPTLGSQTPAEAGVTYQAFSMTRYASCPTQPVHQAIDPATGGLRPIRVCVPKAASALEYRLFRRVDDGPLALFAQGTVTGQASAPICRSDDSLVSHGSTIHYYVQYVGGNGTVSPVKLVGLFLICVEPPVPVLAPPKAAGTAAAPTVELHWSCPPQGVDRFEIMLTPKSGERLSSFQLAGASSIIRPQTLFNPSNPAGRLNTFKLARTPNGTTKKTSVQEKLLTARLGTGGIGEGPAFTISIPVRAYVEYTVSVRALGPAPGCLGKFSIQYPFQWKPEPAMPDRSVPWPARPLPPVTADPAEQIVASLLPPEPRLPNYNEPSTVVFPDAGYKVATGVCIGYLRENGAVEGNEFHFLFQGVPSGSMDIEKFLFKRPGGRGGSLLPAMLYRQQVANGNFPTVSGAITQASPMIRKISWRSEPWADYFGNPGARGILSDPFIAVISDFFGYDQSRSSRLYLPDNTPVIRGATYRYWLVCFTDAGEPDVVISSPDVTIPLTP
jgi:hypothetical protein